MKRLGFSLTDPCQFDILQSGPAAGNRRDFITQLGSAAASTDILAESKTSGVIC